MDLPILVAAALGVAVFTVSDGLERVSVRPEGPEALIGQRLYASEDPVARWGAPPRAEDLALEDLGRVAQVVTSPEGEPRGLVVEVGGLWGFGAQDVELGMQRVHLLLAADGEQRLVVDLSANGAAPDPDGEAQFDL